MSIGFGIQKNINEKFSNNVCYLIITNYGNNLFETGVQRGGWQTPQKLESISRYSPIRRVTRKKKNKKRKKKRRKKQTKKRRGKKRN